MVPMSVMRLCENNRQKSKYVKILMNNRNIMCGLSPPMVKVGKSKNDRLYVLMNVENNPFMDPFLHR